MNVHLDTHVAIWMVAGDTRRLRPVARLLRDARPAISPVVVVELELLWEIGRLTKPVDQILDVLKADHGVGEATGDLAVVASHARRLGWTRDPFDRFIVAHALASRAILLSADETIRAHCPEARWGR